MADISGRLRRVCDHLSADQFADLVRDIAEVTMKYEGAATPTVRERPTRYPDRAADMG